MQNEAFTNTLTSNIDWCQKAFCKQIIVFSYAQSHGMTCQLSCLHDVQFLSFILKLAIYLLLVVCRIQIKLNLKGKVALLLYKLYKVTQHTGVYFRIGATDYHIFASNATLRWCAVKKQSQTSVSLYVVLQISALNREWWSMVINCAEKSTSFQSVTERCSKKLIYKTLSVYKQTVSHK